MSVMVSEALREPGAFGVNVKLIAQLALATRLLLHVVVWAKSPGFSPPMVMLDMLSKAAPLFVSVTFCATLVVPRFCWLNARLVGQRLTKGAGGGGELPPPPQVAQIPIMTNTLASSQPAGRRRMADRLRSSARASDPANSQSNPTGRRKLGGTLRCKAGGALLAAVVVMVNVLVTAEALLTVTDDGESVQVAPVGQPPATMRLTVPVNPYCGATLIVEVPAWPGAETVTGEGSADRLKSVMVIEAAAEVELA